MNIVTHALQKFIGTNPVDIGLADGLEEIKADGYERITVDAGAWDQADGQIRADQMFGPFGQTVSFDRVVLFDGENRIQTIKLADRVALPAGMTYANRAVVNVKVI